MVFGELNIKHNDHCDIAWVHLENSRIFWSYTTSYCLCNSVSDSYQVLYIHGDSTYFSIHIEWVIVHLIFCNKNNFFSSAEFCLTTWENNDLGFFAWYLSVSQWAHRCMQCTDPEEHFKIKWGQLYIVTWFQLLNSTSIKYACPSELFNVEFYNLPNISGMPSKVRPCILKNRSRWHVGSDMVVLPA